MAPWASSTTGLSSRGSSPSSISKRTYPYPAKRRLTTVFIYPELFFLSLFQLPVFVIGAYGLWRGKVACGPRFICGVVIVTPPLFFFSRLARYLRPACALRRLYLHDDLGVRCRRTGYPHHVRRNHRAKARLYHPRGARHASL